MEPPATSLIVILEPPDSMSCGVELPVRLSLILDMGQLYYNSSLSNNNLDQMLNTSISINYRFR